MADNFSDVGHAMPPVSLTGQRRKRPRAARACEFCRAKKYRCDELDPCSKCRKRNKPCIYKDADLARERFHIGLRQRHDSLHDSSADASLSEAHETPQVNHASYDDGSGEVSEVNRHTLNTEFHGPTSSLAFLAAVQKHAQEDTAQSNDQSLSLVSAFHNESFSPDSARQRSTDKESAPSIRYHFRQSRFFLDGYFQNLHFIHPVIDKAAFLSRCEDLWFGRADKQPRSFVALYYAVMSLGAIIQEWDEDIFDGMDRFEWARRMFHLAADALGLTPGSNDLETVQANLVMAKICQNELNPHLAYMYLGRAVRTALSAGFNRRSRRSVQAGQPAVQCDIAKTWWGLYSLEVEMSFALGRPDSLGLDVYHNQTMPPVDDTEHAILTAMVDFARIVRKVSVSVHASTHSITERLAKAAEIESTMVAWIESLPNTISPVFHGEQTSTMAKEPKWAKKQKHTLKFRYFNVKMVLYRPFLLHAATTETPPDPGLQAAVKKCISSAQATLQLMHQMYCDLPYFRTWWYNVNYTLYAASIILCYLARLAEPEEKDDMQRLINMSIDVLNAMEEHDVAKKAAVVLQKASSKAQEKDRSTEVRLPQQTPQPVQTPLMQLANVSFEASQGLPSNELLLDPFNDIDLDFMPQLFPFDDNYVSPWLS